MAKVLIIDDSELMCAILSRIIKRMGHEAVAAPTLGEGVAAAEQGEFDVVLLDVVLPDGNGLDYLSRIQAAPSVPEVIIITSEGDPRGAALAIHNGAWDYLEKGSSSENVTLSVVRALQYRAKKTAVRQVDTLRREGLIGSSPRIRECLDLLAKSAASDASVLITGETGTGKELAARAIHANSSRAGNEFVVVDCAALPDNLVESILFGHVKGAFTGADRDTEGLIRSADGGTLFLDEIGELPMGLQKTFLRVLQDRQFRPVGSKTEMRSDFRLVAATNRNVDEMVSHGLFRSDLLFRVRSFHLVMPPLRERIEDIREITAYHVTRLCDRYNLESKAFSPDFFEALESYDWPGNARELVHVLERTVIRARQEPYLFPKHLPTHIRAQHVRSAIAGSSRRPEGEAGPQGFPSWKTFREQSLTAAGKKYFRDLMAMAGGDIRRACAISGLSMPRLYALLKEHEVTKNYALG